MLPEQTSGLCRKSIYVVCQLYSNQQCNDLKNYLLDVLIAFFLPVHFRPFSFLLLRKPSWLLGLDGQIFNLLPHYRLN